MYSYKLFIISQLFMAFGLGAQILTYMVSNRRHQLLANIISNLSMNVCFVMLGGWILFIMNSVAILRDSVSLYTNIRNRPLTHKNQIRLLFVWLTLQTIPCLYIATGPASLLGYLGGVLFTISIWQRNIVIYRIMGLGATIMSMLYNIALGNVIGYVIQMIMATIILTKILYTYIQTHKSHHHMIHF